MTVPKECLESLSQKCLMRLGVKEDDEDEEQCLGTSR